MYFQPFYLSCLAHASYLLGSEGIAAVVDPQRDVEIYIEDAKQQGLRIAYVIETHLHADFVSGHQELAARTGAKICISEAAHAKFPHRAMRDGETLQLGRCTLEFLATPGHTPEGMCIVVTDRDASEKPWAVLTGDTLFIGDVGRPIFRRILRRHSSLPCFTTACTASCCVCLAMCRYFPRTARVPCADAISAASAAPRSARSGNSISPCSP